MNRRMFLALPALLLALAFAAEAADAEATLLAAEKKWAAAVLANDTTALEGIFTDGLIYAHSTGAVESKEQYLNRLKTGAQHYTAITYSSSTVRIYGDAAVVHSRLNMRGTSNERIFDDQLLLLHVWVKQAGQWRLAAHQSAKLP